MTTIATTRPLPATGRERWAVIGLLVTGLAVRFAWALGRPDGLAIQTTESERVAVSLATTGQFADAFRAGSGLTAHLSPLWPWLMALVYRAAGVAAPAAEFVLSCFAIGLTMASFGFVYLLMRELGAPLWSRLAALAVVCLVPIQFALEVRELKVWEAPMVVALVTGSLLWAVRLDRRPRLDWRPAAPLVLPGALLFVASPPGALAVFAIVAVLGLRRLPLRQCFGLGALALAVTALVTAPWVLRNEAVFGRTIVTRSNGGLELALAYNDTILRTADRRAGYLARLDEIHPAPVNGNGLAAMRAAGGEIAYYDRLGAQAKQWIAAHPQGSVELFWRHVCQYFVPPAWFFNTWGPPANAVEIRRWLLGVPMLVALFALPALIVRDRRYAYVAVAAILLAAPYVVVQPILRYRYLTSTLAMFVAFNAVAVAWQWLRQRRRVPAASAA